jgi:hypothetical protein
MFGYERGDSGPGRKQTSALRPRLVRCYSPRSTQSSHRVAPVTTPAHACKGRLERSLAKVASDWTRLASTAVRSKMKLEPLIQIINRVEKVNDLLDRPKIYGKC